MREALVRAAPAGRLGLTGVTGPLARRLGLAAGRLTVLAAFAPIAVYIWLAAHRIGYPYELDWLEGGAVELVGRVLDGRSLYAAPSLGYVGYTYPPLYWWVSAAVAEVTGLGFAPLRLVSFACSLVSFAALWRLVAIATTDRAAGVVAAGLFAATYGLTGWWFDVGRVDSMFVALTLVALCLGRSAHSATRGAVVGAVAFLAFFTKQTAVVALAPTLLYLLVARPRAGISAVAVLGVLVAGSTLLLDAVSDGWYRYYVVSELAGQPWVPSEWLGFWRADLYEHLRPLVLLLGLAGAGSAAAAWRTRRLGIGYELAAVVGLLLAAWFSRLHTGGYVNVLMPAYAACALLAGLAYARLRRIGTVPALVAVVLVLVQLVMLLDVPDHALPTRSEQVAGAELISRLRSLPGPVLVLGHPWYGTVVGKGSFAQADAITEVLRSDGPRGSTDLRRALRGALDRYGVEAVVLDGPPPLWLAPQLARDFIPEPRPITAAPLRPPAESGSAPTYLYVRKNRPYVRKNGPCTLSSLRPSEARGCS